MDENLIELPYPTLESKRFTLTCVNGFIEARRPFRKSLGSIPFKKLDIGKAGLTQQVASRRSSLVKVPKRPKQDA